VRRGRRRRARRSAGRGRAAGRRSHRLAKERRSLRAPLDVLHRLERPKQHRGAMPSRCVTTFMHQCIP
jgi:hypothetical protein